MVLPHPGGTTHLPPLAFHMQCTDAEAAVDGRAQYIIALLGLTQHAASRQASVPWIHLLVIESLAAVKLA